ncbi:YidC/Oxa1 family membrane protein insertase [Candidatus Shapirobacteria bacterium]|nr:YidC/Oxa1 family membrane protein insertase [Candidatus Shapirobacteria bacterium]
MNILVSPFVNALFGFYYLLGNLGWSVIVVTVLIRVLLIPLVLPSLKSAKKMAVLQPRLKKLQEKYAGNKEGLAKAQMDLYKEEGINPLSGCLPQILQIAVLIMFFSAFNLVTNYTIGKSDVNSMNKELVSSFKISEGFKFETMFLGSNLSQTPADIYKTGLGMEFILPLILLLGSGVLQYFSSKLMMPSSAASQLRTGKPVGKIDQSAYVKATPEKSDDMMEMMRMQSTYMMPLMTIFIGWNFSLGMLLYWFVNSGVMLVQQLVVGKMDKDKKTKL